MPPAHRLVILVALLAGTALILHFVLPALGGALAEPDGLPCDLPPPASGECVEFEERGRFDPAEQTPLTPDERPFTRIQQPNDVVDIWSTVAAVSVAAALGLAGPHTSGDTWLS